MVSHVLIWLWPIWSVADIDVIRLAMVPMYLAINTFLINRKHTNVYLIINYNRRNMDHSNIHQMSHDISPQFCVESVRDW